MEPADPGQILCLRFRHQIFHELTFLMDKALGLDAVESSHAWQCFKYRTLVLACVGPDRTGTGSSGFQGHSREGPGSVVSEIPFSESGL